MPQPGVTPNPTTAATAGGSYNLPYPTTGGGFPPYPGSYMPYPSTSGNAMPTPNAGGYPPYMPTPYNSGYVRKFGQSFLLIKIKLIFFTRIQQIPVQLVL